MSVGESASKRISGFTPLGCYLTKQYGLAKKKTPAALAEGVFRLVSLAGCFIALDESVQFLLKFCRILLHH